MTLSIPKTLLSAALFFLGATLTVTAQGASTVTGGLNTLKGIIETFSTGVAVAFGTLLMGCAVIVFFMGIIQYIWGLRQGDSAKAKTGSSFMTWGLLALFVMFSVYGIVNLAQSIFLKDVDTTTIKIPKLKFETTGGGSPAGVNIDLSAEGTPCAVNSGVCTLKNGAAGICLNNICRINR